MFNWIWDQFDKIWHGIQDVYNWVWSQIQAVYNWAWGWIQYLGETFQNWLVAIGRWFDAVYGYIESVYVALQVMIGKYINDAINWYWGLIQQAYHDIHDVYGWVTNKLDALSKAIEHVFSDIINWAINNIYDPLANDIRGGFSWLSTQISQLWDAITNPGSIATTIGRWLLGIWLSLLRRYAGPIAKWLLHTMLSEASTFADIIETMIAAIL